ncbi:hypothetical protein FOZ63_000622, partial [Perkinsus olseni]
MRCFGSSTGSSRDPALEDVLARDSTTILSATFDVQGEGLRLQPPVETRNRVLVYGAPFADLVVDGYTDDGRERAAGYHGRYHPRGPSSGIHSERPFSRDGHRRVGERSTGKLHSALVSAPVVLEGRVFGNRRIDEVSVGAGHALLRCSQGRVYAFGRNEYGQCGVGNFREVIQEVTPVCIGPSEELVASRLATGAFHSLCVNLDGQVLVWGHADYLGVDRAAIKARCATSDGHMSTPTRLDVFDATTAYAVDRIAARGRASYALLTRKEKAASLRTTTREEFKWSGLVAELRGEVTTDSLALAVCLRRHGRLLCREEVGLDIGNCQVGEADM